MRRLTYLISACSFERTAKSKVSCGKVRCPRGYFDMIPREGGPNGLHKVSKNNPLREQIPGAAQRASSLSCTQNLKALGRSRVTCCVSRIFVSALCPSASLHRQPTGAVECPPMPSNAGDEIQSGQSLTPKMAVFRDENK